MSPSSYISYFIKFILIVFAQAIILKGLVVFEMAFCFAYIGFVLFLPISTNFVVLMTIGFILGISTDIFYDTAGIHTAATVFIAFLRPHYLNLITPRGGYDNNPDLSIDYMGFQWIALYLLPLLFLHHLLLFLIEAYTFDQFFSTLFKTFISTIYTFLIIVIYLRLTEKGK